MPGRIPRFEKGQALSHGDLNALSEAISEQERGEWQRGRRRRIADFICTIVAVGPGGQPDFADSRYWVRQASLETENQPGGAPTRMTEIQFGTSGPVWAEAINLNEVTEHSHGLPIGTIVRIFEVRDSGGKTHFVFTSTATSAGGSQEVVISKIVRCDDPSDAQETSTCAGLSLRDHLRCYPIDADGNAVLVEPYLPTFPNWGHTISEFSPVAWNPNDPNQPTFQVFRGGDRGGWVMSFGQGQRWVVPPTDLCGGGDPDPDAEGACCHEDETCTNTTQAECNGPSDQWKGAGTTCEDDPDPCEPSCFGGECEPLGSCCCEATADCYNDTQAPPSCWSNATEDECLAGGGTWDGTTGGPCPDNHCGKFQPNGACCLGGGKCVLVEDDFACGLMGGAWLGDPSCDPNPCGDHCTNPQPPIGACCNPTGGCMLETGEECCTILGGNWFGGGSTCADCP